VLIGQTAYTSVRRRRPEFGMLRALGWPQWRVLLLVELEMLLLALGAGVSAVVLGLALARATGLNLSLLQLALTLPLALALTAAASLPPAFSAARGSVLRVMERGVRARRSRPLLGVVHLGLRDLLRQSRWEAALGVTAVAIGAALVGGVLLISTAFRGQLDTTVLGAYLAGRVRPFHAVLAALTLVVGAIAAAEIVTLGYLERRPQLGALRALGWPRRQLSALVAAQAAALGAGGGLLGALFTLGLGWALSAPPGPALTGVLGALITAVLATALAAVAPVTQAYAGDPADVLRGE
jgi:ABC-type antimicrobial peptide transport system permease subunit